MTNEDRVVGEDLRSRANVMLQKIGIGRKETVMTLVAKLAIYVGQLEDRIRELESKRK